MQIFKKMGILPVQHSNSSRNLTQTEQLQPLSWTWVVCKYLAKIAYWHAKFSFICKFLESFRCKIEETGNEGAKFA